MVLLDTNIFSVWLYRGSPVWETIDQFLKGLGSNTLVVSEVTRGEIEYGITLGSLTHQQQEEARMAINALPILWRVVDSEVANVYGTLRGHLFNRYAPRTSRGNIKTKRAELLPVPSVTGADLQIEENDLWIASTAVAMDIPLASSERGLVRILDEAKVPFGYFHKLIHPSDIL